MQTTCIGCGITLPEAGGPTHRYIVSSPECWNLFGRVLAREYENPVLFGAVHQLTVDTYAVQHPVDHPPKSLVSHLVSLYTTMELGLGQFDGRAALLRFVNSRSEFPHLDPPADLGPVTVLDVANAGTQEEHIDAVRRWARQVWGAWSHQHGLIASLAKG